MMNDAIAAFIDRGTASSRSRATAE
jgi:hypothetical protein